MVLSKEERADSRKCCHAHIPLCEDFLFVCFSPICACTHITVNLMKFSDSYLCAVTTSTGRSE